ncbi:MAG: MFS transporter [Bacteroidota bacterium]
MKKGHPIYNLRFGLLCLSSLLFSSSYNLLIPELPGYLSNLGGSQYIGLIISLFTLTAGLSRPFSGLLTDRVGRRPVMVFGAMVCLICGFMYPILGTVAGFLFLRLLHGFSTGFTPTAIAAYVSDIVPANRWGAAFGIQGVFFTSGLALGPALGSTIKLYYSYDILFYSSSAMAFLSMLLIFKLRETLLERNRFKWGMLKISKNDIISTAVFLPALMTFLAYFSFGMVLTLIPDWSDFLGFRNRGSFFVAFTIASLAIRFLAGSASDRMGRKFIVTIGLLILISALLVMMFLQTKTGLLTAAIIYGLAMGILSPALNAWTVDLSPSNERGKGISTMFIALEAGIGLGALLSGWYYRESYQNIPHTMLGCAFLAMVGLAFLSYWKKRS